MDNFLTDLYDGVIELNEVPKIGSVLYEKYRVIRCNKLAEDLEYNYFELTTTDDKAYYRKLLRIKR